MGIRESSDTSSSYWFTDKTLTSAIGEFRTKEIRININVTGTESGVDFSVILSDTLNLTPGIGIISRDIDYTNDREGSSAPQFTHRISAVSELPHPITFVKSGASPTPSIPEDTSDETYDQDAIFNFSSDGINISSDQYNITNMADINTAGWVNITKDDINKNYIAEILVNENTPVSSTSVLVMF